MHNTYAADTNGNYTSEYDASANGSRYQFLGITNADRSPPWQSGTEENLGQRASGVGVGSGTLSVIYRTSRFGYRIAASCSRKLTIPGMVMERLFVAEPSMRSSSSCLFAEIVVSEECAGDCLVLYKRNRGGWKLVKTYLLEIEMANVKKDIPLRSLLRLGLSAILCVTLILRRIEDPASFGTLIREPNPPDKQTIQRFPRSFNDSEGCSRTVNNYQQL